MFDNPDFFSTDESASVTAAKILQPRDVHVFFVDSESVQVVPKMTALILSDC